MILHILTFPPPEPAGQFVTKLGNVVNFEYFVSLSFIALAEGTSIPKSFELYESFCELL